MLMAGNAPREAARMLEGHWRRPKAFSIWRCSPSNSANRSPGNRVSDGYMVPPWWQKRATEAALLSDLGAARWRFKPPSRQNGGVPLSPSLAAYRMPVLRPIPPDVRRRLTQWVVLSLLLHALGIMLFGA